MGTRGFIAIKGEGKTLGTYNHFDSYPSWLGLRMLEFVQRQDFADLVAKLATLQRVDEQEEPTAEQLADLKERGFWQDVGTGRDWYSALRGAQGDLAAYLTAGYIPALDVEAALNEKETWLEWGYIVDLDASSLDVYASEYGVGWRKAASYSFEFIRGQGDAARSAMERL